MTLRSAAWVEVLDAARDADADLGEKFRWLGVGSVVWW
jgi:hypothetical protein